jgi:hypothetical protein
MLSLKIVSSCPVLGEHITSHRTAEKQAVIGPGYSSMTWPGCNKIVFGRSEVGKRYQPQRALSKGRAPGDQLPRNVPIHTIYRNSSSIKKCEKMSAGYILNSKEIEDALE